MTTAIPSSRVLRQWLVGITETLAQELVNPTVFAPDWSEAHWRLARAVSAIHGISGLLAGRLRWREAPPSWSSFLVSQRDQTAIRQGRIRRVLLDIDRAALTHGVTLLAMKGSALEPLKIYTPGERPMSDIDLLALPHDMHRAAGILRSLGFRDGPISARDRMFVPQDTRAPASLGEGGANDINIELHARYVDHLPLCRVDASGSIFPATRAAGLHTYPSLAALMFHLALHTASNMAMRTLRLIQLHDIARLSVCLNDADWEEVLRLASQDRHGAWWLFPPLAFMQRYIAPAPQFVLQHARRGCPRSLLSACRRQGLTDLSLSHPWIAPFPALPWTRSLPESLQYIWLRVFRTDVSVRTTAFRENPNLAGGSWRRFSRARRLLGWGTGRVPRVGTFAAIEAAFAEPN